MPTSDWIKTCDYISWAGLYDNVSLATSLYSFHLLKRTIYETSAPGTLSNVDLDSDKSPFDTLTQYDDEEELDLSLVLSSGPNWNHNVPLPPTPLQVINTSFDFEKPSNSKATFSREDATTCFKMTEELRALVEEAEVPSSFRELEIKVPLLFIITLLS